MQVVQIHNAYSVADAALSGKRLQAVISGVIMTSTSLVATPSVVSPIAVSRSASLGLLAPQDDATRRLAGTLHTDLDENGIRRRTAKRLSIHENTVVNRLREVEELVGRSVDKHTYEPHVLTGNGFGVGTRRQMRKRMTHFAGLS